LADLQYLECCYITFPEFFFIYFLDCIYRCRCRCSFQSLFWSCLSYTRSVDLCSKQNVFPAFVSFKCALHSLSLSFFLIVCRCLSYCLPFSLIVCLFLISYVSLSYCLSLSLTLSIRLSLYISICLYLSLNVLVSLSPSLSLARSFCRNTFCKSAELATFLHCEVESS
jgi:hypothetical protein